MKPEALNVVRSAPFHRYIRAARLRRELSVRAVADYIGISASHLVDVEKGRRPLRGDSKMRLLAEILKVPLEVLEEKKGITPWGREPWFVVGIDDTLRASVRFLPAARAAFRKFEEQMRVVIERAPLAIKDKNSVLGALDELKLVMGDGDDK